MRIDLPPETRKALGIPDDGREVEVVHVPLLDLPWHPDQLRDTAGGARVTYHGHGGRYGGAVTEGRR